MIRKLAREDFDAVYRLIEKSFPEDEYRTYAEQKALLDDPTYEIYIFSDFDSAVSAFMAVWEFDAFVFLEHFAVDPACRNRGIGSRFLKELLLIHRKMVCLEVELPENETASRRIGFYERNHFFLNQYPYMQPSISKGRKPVPLFIMTSGRPINPTEFAEIKETLYTRVYRQKMKKD